VVGKARKSAIRLLLVLHAVQVQWFKVSVHKRSLTILVRRSDRFPFFLDRRS
jgi:hypothetical protein